MELKLHPKRLQSIPLRQRMNEQKVMYANAISKKAQVVTSYDVNIDVVSSPKLPIGVSLCWQNSVGCMLVELGWVSFYFLPLFWIDRGVRGACVCIGCAFLAPAAPKQEEPALLLRLLSFGPADTLSYVVCCKPSTTQQFPHLEQLAF